MTISLRLNDEDSKIIKAYAEMYGMTVSDLVRTTVLDRIENEFDLKSYNEAIEEYKNNPVTHSHEEVAKLLNLE